MHAASHSPRPVQDAPAQRLMKSVSPWRVLIVDHHAVVRQMMRIVLESYSEIIEVVGEASDRNGAIEQAQRYRPDLVLMDVTSDGVDTTRDMKQNLPDVVIVGMAQTYSPENYNAMIAAGAVAFVHKEEASNLLFRTVVYAMSTYSPSQLHDTRLTSGTTGSRRKPRSSVSMSR